MVATSIAIAQAPSIWGSRFTEWVISVARIRPVTGARTEEVKKAAMPMRAMPAGSGVTPGRATAPTSPTSSPRSDPITSMGANSPPGVSAA